MTDNLTKEQRSYGMSRIRRRDTLPELMLRRAVWKRACGDTGSTVAICRRSSGIVIALLSEWPSYLSETSRARWCVS